MTPATPRPASTVVVVRDARTGPEVLLLRRPPTGFAADAWVFPGGVVDTDDYRLAPPRSEEPREWAARLGVGDPTEAWAHVAAALRETWEETGLVLGSVAVRAAELAAARRAVLERAAAFPDVAAAVGLRPATGSLVYLARWVTPESIARRYDTRFFVAPVASGAAVTLAAGELVDARWLAPHDAIRMHGEGRVHLMVPTLHTLHGLTRFASVAEMLRRLALETPRSYLPGMRPDSEGVIIEPEPE